MYKNVDPIEKFEKTKQDLMKLFRCKEDYFVKYLRRFKWCVKDEDDLYILSYWNDNDMRADAIIVKKNGEPMIYKAKKHTMVVAIDCVKIAFVFNDAHEVGK